MHHMEGGVADDDEWILETVPPEVGIEVEVNADVAEEDVQFQVADENCAPDTLKSEMDTNHSTPTAKNDVIEGHGGVKSVKAATKNKAAVLEDRNLGNNSESETVDAGNRGLKRPVETVDEAAESTSSISGDDDGGGTHGKREKLEAESKSMFKVPDVPTSRWTHRGKSEGKASSGQNSPDLTRAGDSRSPSVPIRVPQPPPVKAAGVRYELRRIRQLTDDADDGMNVIKLDAKNRFVIGRLPSCDITLDDIRMSRRHAVLERDLSGKWFIENSSLNGIKVQKDVLEKDQRVHLIPGMVLQFCENLDTKFTFMEIPKFSPSESPKSPSPEPTFSQLETQPFDFETHANLKEAHRIEVDRLEATQREETGAVRRELEANKKARLELEEQMEELGSKLEAQNKNLAEKRDAEEILRQRIADFTAKEESLVNDLEARDKRYAEQLQRIHAESEAKLAEATAQMKAALAQKEAELEKQREAANLAARSAVASEREAAEKRVSEVEAEVAKWRKMAEVSEQTVASIEGRVMQGVGETLTAELECAICNEIFVKAVTLNCSHSFCTECLHKWSVTSARSRNDKGSCPTCRVKIVSTNASRAIDSLVASFIQKMGPEKIAERRALEAQHEMWKAEREAGSSSNGRRSARSNRRGDRSSRQPPIPPPVHTAPSRGPRPLHPRAPSLSIVPRLSNPANSPAPPVEPLLSDTTPRLFRIGYTYPRVGNQGTENSRVVTAAPSTAAGGSSSRVVIVGRNTPEPRIQATSVRTVRPSPPARQQWTALPSAGGTRIFFQVVRPELGHQAPTRVLTRPTPPAQQPAGSRSGPRQGPPPVINLD